MSGQSQAIAEAEMTDQRGESADDAGRGPRPPSAAWAGEELVWSAQHGDAASLTELLTHAHPHVNRFAQSLCSSPQDAEDAAQEALMILYRKIGTLRASAALASWMFRIVRNECLRRARLARVRARHEQVDDLTSVEPVVGNLEDDVLRRLEVERVAAALAALPTPQRRVLVMRDVQGLPGRMVADTLGLSVPAMKSLLHRSRLALRQSLSEPNHPTHPEEHR